MGFQFDRLSGEVIAAAVQVHKVLGPGFIENVYEQALKLELNKRKIRFESQKQIQVFYAGQTVGTHVLDLLVEDQLIVELKAVAGLEDVHFAQVRSYLSATGAKVGLLMNFNSPKLTIKRIVRNFEQSNCSNT
ncbi:MAG: GxxExxY protein [Armatimonadota bacterium]|nr:GxxExxY protein [bacterium]